MNTRKNGHHGVACALTLIGGLGLLLPSGKGLAQTYSVTDLGALVNVSGRDESKPYDLNALGHVAAVNVASGAYRGFRYAGSWQNLGTLGGVQSFATGLNDSGRVVGYSRTVEDTTRAFLWTPGGTDGVPGNPQMKDLGTLGNGASQAAAINTAGQITGYYEQLPDRAYAFLYQDGKMNNLADSLSRLPNTFGYGINDFGHVVGEAWDSRYTRSSAFFYDGTTLADLGGLGGKYASALAINNSDEIVGYAAIGGDSYRAFLYRNGVMTNLGTLGGDYSYALDINDHGAIVGGAFADAANTRYRAFVTEGTALVDLNTRLNASGQGWTLLEARAINNLGQIVGVGAFGGGNRVFLLTPESLAIPAPAIEAVSFTGSDVVVEFTTVTAARYDLESSTSLLPASWSPVVTGIPGTGGVVAVPHAGAAGQAHRFYRVRVAP